jgi:DNA-binding beta-propeller fold protein YncE
MRRRQLLIAAALAASVTIAVGLSLGLGRTVGQGQASPRSSGLTLTPVRLGGAPVAVARAQGSVWTVVETRKGRAELVRLNPKNGKRVAAFVIGRAGPDFGAAAVGGDFVWAAAGEHLIRVNPDRPGHVARVALPGEAAALTVGYGSAWVASIGKRQDTITRLDASTLAVQKRDAVLTQPVALEVGLGTVWLASTGGLWKIDPKSNRLIPSRIPVPGPIHLSLFGDRLWLIEADRTLVALDRNEHVRVRITLPFSPGALAATGKGIWVTNNCGCLAGKLAVLNPRSHRLIATRKIGETPVAITAAGSQAWVATFGDSRIWLAATK